MMSGKLVDTFRQTKAPAEQRKAVLRSAFKGSKPEAALAVSQASCEPDADALETLRQFDLTGRYGPCTGVTRLERWERASKLGLHPPPEVKAILDQQPSGSANLEGIWTGRV